MVSPSPQVQANCVTLPPLNTDENAVVTFLNAVAEAITGWTSREAKGQPLRTVFNASSMKPTKAALSGGRPSYRQRKLRAKDARLSRPITSLWWAGMEP